MTFPAYPEYKNSGVEWLGKVPTDWSIVPIKHTSSIVGGTTPKSDTDAYWDGEFVWITPADLSKLNGTEIFDSQRKISQLGFESCGLTLVPPKSIVLSTRAPIGSLGIASVELATNQGCKSLITKSNIDSKFLFYVLSISTEALNVRGRGTTFLELSADELGVFRVPVPNLETQRSIASFLDHETGKIDELIHEQEKLIELLNEKRQTIISNTVCRGIDPNVPMKDSGVEWLGMVPEHWGIVKTKKIATRISSGKTPSGGAEVYVDDGVIFIRSQNVHDDGLRLDDVVKIPYAIDEAMANTRVKAGDILLNITGASIGRSCVVPSDFSNGNVNQHVCVIRLRESELIPYVELFFKSINIKNQIDLAQNGAAREGLNFEQIGGLLLCMPPLLEQIEIAEFVKNQLMKFSNLVSEANSAIHLLNERRSVLISAAVTGQIDVRNYQPRS